MSSRLDLGPKPHLGYTESRIDRAADRRTDEAALNALVADPRARAYVIGVDLIVMKSGARITRTVDAPRGSAPRGIEWSDVEEKYHALMPQSKLPARRTLGA